jgi:hypothetical protein
MSNRRRIKATFGREALGFCGRDRDGPSADARPPASLRSAMAPSGSGSLRDRQTGRWPLSLLAGTQARTLAALAYTASEPSLPRPHAELAPVQESASSWTMLCSNPATS